MHVLGFPERDSALREDIRLRPRMIRTRFPYIDPPAYAQSKRLKPYRDGDAGERVVQGIQLTINGVAAGLRNSG